MQMSNIRPNFTNLNDQDQRQFFLTYAEKRAADFLSTTATKVVKMKKASSKEPKLKLTPAQLALLKTLGLV